jgi:hypothetical protein
VDKLGTKYDSVTNFVYIAGKFKQQNTMSELLTPAGYISNMLVNGRYEYSAGEIDLMIRLVVCCRGKTGPVKIPLSELTDADGGSRFERLRENLRHLQSKPLEFFNPETKITWSGNLIAWCTIEKFTGILTVNLSPLILELLNDLKSNYTTFQIEALLNLSSKYSKRLYLLACQFKSTGIRFFNPEELKKALKVDNVYTRLADFEKRVIFPALDEINAKTDLVVDYEKQKTGRSVTGQCITVKLKQQVAQITGDENQRRIMLKYGLAPWQISNVFQYLQFEQIARLLYDFQIRRETIKNPGAYLVTTYQRLGVPMDKPVFTKQTDLISAIHEVTSSKH